LDEEKCVSGLLELASQHMTRLREEEEIGAAHSSNRPALAIAICFFERKNRANAQGKVKRSNGKYYRSFPEQPAP
jgi:hypothetical protein